MYSNLTIYFSTEESEKNLYFIIYIFDEINFNYLWVVEWYCVHFRRLGTVSLPKSGRKEREQTTIGPRALDPCRHLYSSRTWLDYLNSNYN